MWLSLGCEGYLLGLFIYGTIFYCGAFLMFFQGAGVCEALSTQSPEGMSIKIEMVSWLRQRDAGVT